MEPDAAGRLRQLIAGFRSTQIVYVAAKLGLADRLAEQPRTAAELAKDLGVNPDALYRFARALTSVGILTESADGTFRMDAAGELLRTNAPESMRNAALLYGNDWLWQAYGNTLYSIQTGKSAFSRLHGRTFYEFLEQHADASAAFYAAMDDFSRGEMVAILDAYCFDGVNSVMDVGSGPGVLLAAILQVYPQLRGAGFDTGSAESEFTRRFDDAGLRGRAAFVAGDFFRELPKGYDLYLLKSVLHNWDDDACRRIINVCRQALSSTARLLIIERVISDASPSTEAKLFDINMLVTLGGRERTEREYSTLLEEGGFRVSRVIQRPLPSQSLKRYCSRLS